VHLLTDVPLSAAYLGTDAVGVANITWSWDDGSFGWGQVVEHAWSDAGDYAVTLHVTDAAGNLNTTVFRVVVERPPDDGGGGPGPGDGSSAPPIPTAEVLSPMSLVLVFVGVGAGAAVTFFATRRAGQGPARK
jgi:hypothetical protein